MKLMFISALIAISGHLYGQSVEELDKRNGFKDIKLTSSITNYEGLEYAKDIEDKNYPEAKLYIPKKGYYESIGSLKIFDLQVKTYHDAIYKIIVVTEKDPKLYKGLKQVFGEPEYAYRSGKYLWAAKNLSLSYTSHSKNKIEMVYTSYRMRDKLQDDKQETIEEIADDF